MISQSLHADAWLVEFVFEYVPGLAASQDGSDDDEDESEVSTPPPLGLAQLSPHSQSPLRVSFVEEDPIGGQIAVSVSEVVPAPVQQQAPSHSTGDETTPDDCLWLPGHDQVHNGPSPDGTGSSGADYSSRSVSFILTPAAAPAHLASPHHLLRRHWPLENDHEATLLRHFVTDLSSWVGPLSPRNILNAR